MESHGRESSDITSSTSGPEAKREGGALHHEKDCRRGEIFSLPQLPKLKWLTQRYRWKCKLSKSGNANMLKQVGKMTMKRR
jgi:hypothetical protein